MEHERCAESVIPHGHSTSCEIMSKFKKTRSLNQIQQYYKKDKTKLFSDSKKYNNNNNHPEYEVENKQKKKIIS